MHAAILIVFLLAQAPVPQPTPAHVLDDGTRAPTYSGAVDWSRSWAADWGAAAAGMSANVLCTAASAAFTCTGGVSGTPENVPTASYAPGYPAEGAITYNGTDQSHAFGNSFSIVSGGGICTKFVTTTLTGDANLMGRWDANEYQWTVWRNGATLKFTITKDKTATSGASTTTITLGTLVANQWATACWSMTAGADGAGVMAGNFNGTAATPSTTAVQPVLLGASEFRVATGATGRWAGSVGAIAFGSPMSAAAMLVATASQQARLAAKPVGALATVTSGPTTCVGTSGTLYSLPAGSLCPRADGSGMEIWGAAQHANLLTYSNTFENAAWTKDEGTSVADASASCPLGPLGTAMALFTADGDGEGISQDGTAGTGRGIWLAYPTGGSACNVTLSDASGDGGAAVTLTATPVRATGAAAGQTGIKVAKPAGGCATWCQQAANNQASLIVGPYAPTAGVAATGVADAPSVANTLTKIGSGCWGVRATPAGAWSGGSDSRALFGTGSGSPNRCNLLLLSTALLQYDCRDGAGVPKILTTTAALTGTSEKKVAVCLRADGSSSIYVEEVEQAGTVSGAGSGLVGALMTPMSIGLHSSAVFPWSGSISKVCQGATFAAVNRCLQ